MYSNQDNEKFQKALNSWTQNHMHHSSMNMSAAASNIGIKPETLLKKIKNGYIRAFSTNGTIMLDSDVVKAYKLRQDIYNQFKEKLPMVYALKSIWFDFSEISKGLNVAPVILNIALNDYSLRRTNRLTRKCFEPEEINRYLTKVEVQDGFDLLDDDMKQAAKDLESITKNGIVMFSIDSVERFYNANFL